MAIDTHTHFYDPHRPEGIPWPPRTNKALYRRVMPEDFRAVAEPVGVTRTVVIEASSWVEDNQWLLDLAEREATIQGVVGRLDPNDPHFDANLQRFAANPRFRGLRLGLNNTDVHATLTSAPWQHAFHQLAQNNLTLDVLVPPTHLSPVLDELARYTSLRVVLNHMALAPDADHQLDRAWQTHLQAAHHLPHIHWKISGFPESARKQHQTVPTDPAFYRPVFEAMLDHLGPDRLIYASNWPVSEPAMTYHNLFNIVRTWTDQLDPTTRARILTDNAITAYNLKLETSPMPTITKLQVLDIRFPTSDTLAGSDATHTAPDYSAAYVILHTDHPDQLAGHGLAFTVGRGTEICVTAIEALRPLIVGCSLHEITTDFAAFWHSLVHEEQLRWIGPEKGAVHLAAAAVINAVWDLYAKVENKPLWKLIVDMPPEQLVSCIDFTYITDALTPDEALKMLQQHAPTRAEREAEMRERGYPAYTTSAGWMGYDDDKIRRLCREAIDAGWQDFKLKVGADLDDDCRRAAVMRETIGPDRRMMMDANQRWNVPDAIAAMQRLRDYNPWWIEEPTSPDDILGHAAIARAIEPIGVATGEQCQNRVMFKQLLQAKAISFCQIDSCRLAGVNEVLAVMLMAAKFNVPVCPHAGGVGLCEHVQHLIMIDYICISASLDNRIAEYVDHLHEHFFDPPVIQNGRYMPPTAPGYSITMKPDSRAAHQHTPPPT